MAQTNTPDGTLADRLLQPDPDAHKRWLLAASTVDLAARLHTDRAYAAAPGSDPYSIAARQRAADRVVRDSAALADILTPRLGTACPACSSTLGAGHEGTLECDGCGQHFCVEADALLACQWCADCANDTVTADLVDGRCVGCAEDHERREARRQREEAYECSDDARDRDWSPATYADESHFGGGL